MSDLDARSADRPLNDDDRTGFWVSVGVVLVFSQCWILLATGPLPVQPAVSENIRNWFIPAYIGTFWLLATRMRTTGLAIVRAPLFTALVALTFISLVWTIDPETTQRRSIAVLLPTLAGAAIAARFSWPKMLEVLAATFWIVVILCYFTAIVFPADGIMTTEFPGAWRGVWYHKNYLGFDMSIGAMVFAAAAILNPQRRWLWLLGLVATVLLVILSTSKTSLVSCLMGACCLALVWVARRGRMGAIAAVYVGLLALILTALVFYLAPGLLFALLGKDETLTGRTKIWAAVMRQIAQRPVTGFGYGAVWDSTSVWGPLPWITHEQGFTVREAHNSWLGIWLELGYIGLGIWGLVLAEAWLRTLAGIFRRPSAYMCLPLLTVFSLHTLTESIVLAYNDWVWLIFSTIVFKLAAPEKALVVETRLAPMTQPSLSPA